jgi:hypothetical protein
MKFKQAIALSLGIVLIFIMSSMPLGIASHSLDHHHHSAQTHTTGICAWMCAAAHTISTDSQVSSPDVSLLAILHPLPMASILTPPQVFLPARAPPSLTLFNI